MVTDLTPDQVQEQTSASRLWRRLTELLPAKKDDKEIVGERGEAKQMKVVHGPIDKDVMQAITRLIVEGFDPEKVILFGSHARREAGAHSDLDLLVVIRTDAAQFRRGNPIRRAIAERFVLPVDVIVRSPEHLAEHGRNPKSALYKVLAEGEVLYERNAA